MYPVAHYSMEANSSASDPYKCHDRTTVQPGGPFMSALMFSTGVAGNIIALALLEMRRRIRSVSRFHILVTALLTTDLLGTFSVSPIVLTSYHTNRTLVAMSRNEEVCIYFGFTMTFLSLSTLGILCAMALERYLSIGHPYFYERHSSKRTDYITIALIYLICVLFCVVPLFGFGSYVQYCPGTWCFLDMNPPLYRDTVYTTVYASVTFIMISCTVVFNFLVIGHLVQMYRRRKARGVGGAQQSRMYHRSLSIAEEVELLLPLVFMTVTFVVCSFPLVRRVYLNSSGNVDDTNVADLRALRLMSLNTILDPWVFIILSPSVLRFFWGKIHKQKKSTFNQRTPLAVQEKMCPTTNPPTQYQDHGDDMG